MSEPPQTRTLISTGWKVFLESPTPADEVLARQTQAANPTLGFFILLGLSALIATNGLIASSAATVIGAMIIAPLMQPIGAMAYALATRNRKLLAQAALTMLAGAICTIGISYLAAMIVGVQTAGSEIIGRTSPTVLDLVVAVAAGTAGAFASTRRSIGDAIPGVAIAVALVPPLCVVGIGLALGKTAIPEVGLVLNQEVALGALILFLANLGGIVFSGALVYIVQGYGSWREARRGIVVTVAAIVLISLPLGFSLQELVTKHSIQRHLSALRRERPELYTDVVMRRLNVDIVGETVRVEIESVAPRDLAADIEADTDWVRQYLSERSGWEVEIRSTVIRADIIESSASRPSSRTIENR